MSASLHVAATSLCKKMQQYLCCTLRCKQAPCVAVPSAYVLGVFFCVWLIQCLCCRFIRDDAVEAEAVRQAEAEAEAERRRVASSIRGSLTKQVSNACNTYDYLSSGVVASPCDCASSACNVATHNHVCFTFSSPVGIKSTAIGATVAQYFSNICNRHAQIGFRICLRTHMPN